MFKNIKDRYVAKVAFVFSLFIIFLNPNPNGTVSAETVKALIPVGKTVGITVDSDGIFVLNTTDFKTKDGQTVSPARQAGISPGDRITEIDKKQVASAEELEKICESSGEKEIELKLYRDGNENTVKVTPRCDAEDNKVRIGIWTKDSFSGIGTITFVDPVNRTFGALGHGICGDDGKLHPICGGKIYDAEVSSVNKGEKGAPGELIGIFSENQSSMGDITKNTDNGVIGGSKSEVIAKYCGEEIPIAKREEVKEGEVTILSNIEGKEIAEYSAEILKINDDEDASKGMIIKITDPKLIEKTGGIVQGMSGSPIIKDGKLIGAVTHVFINNPTRGYGIFIDKMLSETE